MRVLITGGAGFIGSALAASLLARSDQPFEVVVLDDLSTGMPDLIAGLPVELMQGSIEDIGLVNAAVAGCDLVFHLAARNIASSVDRPHDDARVNVIGTLNVLLASRDVGVKRVIYASSASIYGPCAVAGENQVPVILSPYAASKLAGEHYCEAVAACYGMTTAIVRFSNVYGPGQSPRNPQCGVISRFLAQALAGQPITVIGDGTQTRDFTYVTDVVDATLKVALELPPGPACDVFNVGTGRETSISDLAVMVGSVVGHATLGEAPTRLIDNIHTRSVNPTKIHRVLDWRPRVGLAEGLAMTRDWIRAHG